MSSCWHDYCKSIRKRTLYIQMYKSEKTFWNATYQPVSLLTPLLSCIRVKSICSIRQLPIWEENKRCCRVDVSILLSNRGNTINALKGYCTPCCWYKSTTLTIINVYQCAIFTVFIINWRCIHHWREDITDKKQKRAAVIRVVTFIYPKDWCCMGRLQAWIRRAALETRDADRDISMVHVNNASLPSVGARGGRDWKIDAVDASKMHKLTE